MKKIATLALSLALSLSISSAALANTITGWGTTNGGAAADFQSQSGLGQADPRAMAGSLVNVMLGFLGIIAVVIILLGGFKWMTAAGNEDKVGEAKKLLAAGVIGLIIILMSYGLAQLVLTQIIDATTNV